MFWVRVAIPSASGNHKFSYQDVHLVLLPEVHIFSTKEDYIVGSGSLCATGLCADTELHLIFLAAVSMGGEMQPHWQSYLAVYDKLDPPCRSGSASFLP